MIIDPTNNEQDLPKHIGLTQILDAARPQDGETHITVGEVILRIGRHSFAATILLIGLLVVSPLSGIPILPAMLALIITLTAAQAIAGRHALWLPRFLTRRKIPAQRLHQALDFLERPARWLDRLNSRRWAVLTYRPLSDIAYLVTATIALSWPPLFLIPFSSTISAFGLTLVAAGLVLRDGVFVLAGYIYTGLLVAGGVALFSGLV